MNIQKTVKFYCAKLLKPLNFVLKASKILFFALEYFFKIWYYYSRDGAVF